MKHSWLAPLAWASFYLFLAAALLANSFGYLDPDFGWHLRVGQTIAETLSVPHDQIYMWTLRGQSWVDHEWLSNLLIYGLWQIGGYLTITAFFIIIPIVTLLILNRYIFSHYLQNTQARFAFVIIEVGALFACLPHFGVRVQEFGFLFLTLLLITIDRVRRTNSARPARWLPLILFLWACLHGSFLIGVAITFGWLIYELVFRSLAKKELKQVLLSGGLALLTTLGTPYGLELYGFLSDYFSNTYYMSRIKEWRSPYTGPFRVDQIAYTLFALTLALSAWFSLKLRPKLWQAGLLFLFLALATRSMRHFPLWAITSLLFIIPQSLTPLFEKVKVPYHKIILILTIFCLLSCSAIFIAGAKINKTPFTSYCSTYPCGAFDFLEKHPEYQTKKMFNDYGWGGYLIGRETSYPLFIDGRLPQYPFNGQTILEEYNLLYQKDKIAQVLDTHNIELILFKAKERSYNPDWIERYFLGRTKQERIHPLLSYLAANPEWPLVYQDTTSKIYVRQK